MHNCSQSFEERRVIDRVAAPGWAPGASACWSVKALFGSSFCWCQESVFLGWVWSAGAARHQDPPRLRTQLGRKSCWFPSSFASSLSCIKDFKGQDLLIVKMLKAGVRATTTSSSSYKCFFFFFPIMSQLTSLQLNIFSPPIGKAFLLFTKSKLDVLILCIWLGILISIQKHLLQVLEKKLIHSIMKIHVFSQ